MAIIKNITAREILDSRGNPTIEADVYLTSGEWGRAAVPSGASTGSREALELRDTDENRYLGKGVRHAVRLICTVLNSALQGMDVREQSLIDSKLIALDGTQNKEKLGANTLLAVSLGVAKAAAQFEKKSLYEYWGHHASHYDLPVPMMNIINGGAHADNNLDFQEFMILPVGLPTFSEALRAGVEIFHSLKSLLKAKKYPTQVGDEGGFAPNLTDQFAAVELILEAITRAGYQPGKDIYLGFDIASTELFHNGRYHLRRQHKIFSTEEWIDYLAKFVDQYPILSIEDGMAENDWEGFRALTQRLGDRVQLVGDDIFVTNTALLQRGIDEHIANAILIKPNQIGTLTETIAAIQLAKKSNYLTIISHRSGETEDTTIADLAVATQANQIKTGSLCRTDRITKYNQLLRIEEQLGNRAVYPGEKIFSRFLHQKMIKEGCST